MTSQNKSIVITIGALLGGLFLGWLLFSGDGTTNERHIHSEAEKDQIWTCSMHPSIRNPEPGSCPICGMDLIPLQPNSGLGDPHLFEMSENALRLANVQTLKLGTSSAAREIRLNGRISVDEGKMAVQTSDVPGRIDRLLVDFTGESVEQGQPLAQVYSPELLTAQEELLQAYKLRDRMPELLEAAKSKLKNWRISDRHINEILENQRASENFVISASTSGVITEKLVEVGDFIDRGQAIFRIADLSQVWVLLDVYENMSSIALEDEVEFTVASMPGEVFKGKVTFIDPVLNDLTRVATARIEVANPEGKLKPEMFVSAVVEVGGSDTDDVLSIPNSAVLWTGERSVVYVKEPNGGSGAFGLREVVLGPQLGDEYIIKEGLAPGDEVVINGAFTVDAAAQLAGRPSMMSPAVDRETPGQQQENLIDYLDTHLHHFSNEVPVEFEQDLESLVGSYLKLKDALVQSDQHASLLAIETFSQILQDVRQEGLSQDAIVIWKDQSKAMEAAVARMLSETNLEVIRGSFDELSVEMTKAVATFGAGGQTLYVEYCPMANADQGAFWLSLNPQIHNPYYGDAMLGCGEVVKELH